MYMYQQQGEVCIYKGKANKSTTPRATLFFPKEKKELPWVGFEPTTLCCLGERSRPRIHVYLQSLIGLLDMSLHCERHLLSLHRGMHSLSRLLLNGGSGWEGRREEEGGRKGERGDGREGRWERWEMEERGEGGDGREREMGESCTKALFTLKSLQNESGTYTHTHIHTHYVLLQLQYIHREMNRIDVECVL